MAKKRPLPDNITTSMGAIAKGFEKIAKKPGHRPSTAQEEAAAELLATEHMAGQFSLALTELGNGSSSTNDHA